MALITFRVPRLPFFGTRSKLRTVLAPHQELQAASNKWIREAELYLSIHGFVLDSNRDPALVLPYTWKRLGDAISALQQSMFINSASATQHRNQIDQNQNFAIAIFSVVLSLSGLIWAILSS